MTSNVTTTGYSEMYKGCLLSVTQRNYGRIQITTASIDTMEQFTATNSLQSIADDVIPLLRQIVDQRRRELALEQDAIRRNKQ